LTVRSRQQRVIMNRLVSIQRVRVRTCIRSFSFIHNKSFPNTIVIAGATCVGKSDVALEFCRRVNQRSGSNVCEIVIADAVQVYKEVCIGCTKPSDEEQAAVPHHLVDYRHLDATSPAMNAGDFVDDAMSAIKSIHLRGHTAVIVGGATMWLDWLLSGKPNAPKGDIEIRAKASALLRSYQERGTFTVGNDGSDKVSTPEIQAVSREAKAQAWREAVEYVSGVVAGNVDGLMTPTVQQEQLQALRKLTANNYKYLSRTLEIALTPSSFTTDLETRAGVDKPDEVGGLIDYVARNQESLSLACFFLSAPDRIPLYRRIDRRCILMLKAGLISEVTDLLLQGRLVPSASVIVSDESMSDSSAAGTVAKSIGYRQAIDFLLSVLPEDSSNVKPLEWNKENITKLQHFLQ
jgi:tRNA A37 N6-isopentenylltransferase MiaA